MSSTVFTAPGDTPASFRRWDVPVKMGVLIGLVSIILSTVSYMFIMPASYGAFLAFSAVVFLVSMVLYWLTGDRQRKAMGGYITIKDAFSAIFIAILISTLMSTIWGIVYARVIDPGLPEKIKESTLSFMESMKAPQSKIDEMSETYEKQIGDSVKPGALIYSYAKSLVITSIFGLICAAIVKRTPKQQMM